jgi:hypothetical protein
MDICYISFTFFATCAKDGIGFATNLEIFPRNDWKLQRMEGI